MNNNFIYVENPSLEVSTASHPMRRKEDIQRLQTLEKEYLKFISVNLSTDTFEGEHIPEDEKQFIADNNIGNSISKYFNSFVEAGRVHPDDTRHFIDWCTSNEMPKTIVYRRLVDGRFRYCYMKLFKDKSYTEDSKECILRVSDIDDVYNTESTRVSERAKRLDYMTGCLNHYAYDDDIRKIRESPKGNTGVAFIDINGLKYTNDHKGHKAGDEVIIKVANDLKKLLPAYNVYRIGGDEFVVIASNVKLRVFSHSIISYHKSLWRHGNNGDNIPYASIGYCGDVSEDIDDIIADAEAQMYEDKKLFYEMYPEYDVRREYTEKKDD